MGISQGGDKIGLDYNRRYHRQVVARYQRFRATTYPSGSGSCNHLREEVRREIH